MVGLSISQIVKITNMPIDSDTANQILAEMMNKGELENKYKDFEIHSNFNNVFYWESTTKTGHFPDDIFEQITVAATPFWDGVKYTPVELDWFTLLNKNGDIVYETSGGGSFYKELKHQTNFESVDELLNWYEEFYLPEVYNLVMNTLLPKMHKLVDYEIKQRG
jgi:flavodoxin